jgi:hypothetical protein
MGRDNRKPSAAEVRQGANYAKGMAGQSISGAEKRMNDAGIRIGNYGTEAMRADPTKPLPKKLRANLNQAYKDRDSSAALSRDLKRITGEGKGWGPMETNIMKPSPSVVKMMALEKARKKGGK